MLVGPTDAALSVCCQLGVARRILSDAAPYDHHSPYCEEGYWLRNVRMADMKEINIREEWLGVVTSGLVCVSVGLSSCC